MPKIKLTKGELKRQRDALRQYQRYLPTLQLKKQQLQLEIMHQHGLLAEKEALFAKKKSAALLWIGLLAEEKEIFAWITPAQIIAQPRNIAGVDFPAFDHPIFKEAQFDFFLAPFWVDSGLEALKVLAGLAAEIALLKKGIAVLKQEERITTQRVNLFEKVKIPEAEEAIRLIKIYIGDQMANAVGRAKKAKEKIRTRF